MSIKKNKNKYFIMLKGLPLDREVQSYFLLPLTFVLTKILLNFKNTYFMSHNKIYFNQEINKKNDRCQYRVDNVNYFLLSETLYSPHFFIFQFPEFSPIFSVFSQYSYSSATSLKYISQYSQCKKKNIVYFSLFFHTSKYKV